MGLKNFFRKIFPPNDWELYKVEQDHCLVDYLEDGVYQYTNPKTRLFKIYFSKHRNKYKLESSGYKYEDSKIYVKMLRDIIQLNKNQ